MTHPLSIGTRVRHPQYGAGIVLDNSRETAYHITFPNFGEKVIGKDYEGLEVIELAPAPEQRLSLGDVERVMVQVLRQWSDISEPVHLGSRWRGGTMILQPGDPDLKAKEIPIETFFHKIVMLRDRLRVLEQQINKQKGLEEDEKINLQQYITRIYGSLTTFNVLFAHKDDYFKGEGKG
ncbi:MAG: hypothetical protein D6722_18975 [Bacteroidetes bacterium]|nr:MAG: hypothetical protein D6722_18975 [Bacteroidota bacterium]